MALAGEKIKYAGTSAHDRLPTKEKEQAAGGFPGFWKPPAAFISWKTHWRFKVRKLWFSYEIKALRAVMRSYARGTKAVLFYKKERAK
ncbi:MAG: hypothetical protein Q4E91_11085 [Lachnospiraceae bacterium]|nr:hypothetical protein [Lachnospiraceae bacterium]